MRCRDTYEIPVGSTADIAFLLLIFFLMAATIETDTGIIRKLPPMDPEGIKMNRKERNSMVILVNRNNQLMVEGERLDISELRNKAKEFIRNGNDNEHLPERYPEKIEGLGEIMITSKHVISLCSDRGTSYDMYIAVQNELAAAYHELRDELAREKFGVNFDELIKKGENRKIVAIEYVYPLRISEAEPVKKND